VIPQEGLPGGAAVIELKVEIDPKSPEDAD
jgi:hypothetical protein